MNFEDFRVRGKKVIDFVCDYTEGVGEKRIVPEVVPGYLKGLVPRDPPKNGESFEQILKDIEERILPGVTQWRHPGFHAYYPTGTGYPSVIAEIVSGALGCVGSSWMSSPACTELETIVLDWLGKAMSIPPHFIYSSPGSIGGGTIQCSTSDCILVCMLAARKSAIDYLRSVNPQENGEEEDAFYLTKLVAYTSKEAHAAVERSARITMIKLRILDVDDQCGLRGPTLADAVHSDQEKGLHPFFVSCTLGTVASCGFDNLKEIGPIVKKLSHCWLHVDGSYAGCGFICPELRYLKEGMEFADSFNTSCSKWLTVSHDCSCLWVKDRFRLASSLAIDSVAIRRDGESQTIDYRNWGVQFTRRFRALKLWLTFRVYGVEGLQIYIRNHCKLAKEFENLVSRDERFEVVNDVRLGLVCFRLVGSDEMNQDLLGLINKAGKIHMIPARVHGKYSIRFCISHPSACQSHIDLAWSQIHKHATDLLGPERGEKLGGLSEEERRRYSYIEDVSPDLYQKLTECTLTDGAGPIYTCTETVPAEKIDKSSEDNIEVFHDVKTS